MNKRKFLIEKNEKEKSKVKKEITSPKKNPLNFEKAKVIKLNELDFRTNQYQCQNKKLLIQLDNLESKNQQLINMTSKVLVEIYCTKHV